MILPTVIIVVGNDRGWWEKIGPNQIPTQWHSRFEAQDLTGKTLTFNGYALLVDRDETDGQERTLHCQIRVDLLGLELVASPFLEPLAEEKF